MAKTKNTDALQVLETIRAENFADRVTPEALAAVYAVEHDKQYEEEREAVRVALRDIIDGAVEEASR
jgi:hypothetical protein